MSDKYHIPFDDAPEHAAALGRLIAHWNVLERLLVIILQWLLGTSWMKALFIYQEFTSSSGKLTLLQRLNHHFNKNEALKNEINEHLKHAITLNGDRNKFIHALWGIKVDDKIVRAKSMEPRNYKKCSQYGNTTELFSPENIQAVVEEIAKLSQSLSDMIRQLGISPGIPLNIKVILPKSD